MTWNELVRHVRAAGRYDDDQETERVLHAVLTALGGQLVGEERRDLAAALPAKARAVLTSQIPLTQPLDAPALVENVAARLATTAATARWDTSSVLTVLADLAGNHLTGRLLAQLPPGYALLFGRAELTTAA
ncbi:DUF2267 domain-containing protein [Kitasatospora sp. MAP5-34]|uniref:DUF2267 domain-containing protein n=1 Tax=Kitasatospora sp. MAP5-34 TaxID=3035102 RepID=UPI002473501A|nr:DUF2267 domain-containing protein [Kitasatospora sp. MAP5-34]MDH6580482.1 uncharacterized protein (DUF2267 family) [Kitasatospora sp. MAP5-34]